MHHQFFTPPTSATPPVARLHGSMRLAKRAALLLALLLAAFSLAACNALDTITAEIPAESQSASGPDLALLSLPAYVDKQPGETETTATGGTLMPVDLWLDATQNMGGINVNTASMYPHYGRKYREGGFHYRYGTTTGWYENVLRHFLTAAGDAKVRTLRYGNETFPAGALEGYGLSGSDAATAASIRRDMYTTAAATNAGLFAQLSAEDMAASFYTLGSPAWLNRIAAQDGLLLENPILSSAMSQALDAQIAGIAAGDNRYVLQPGRSGEQSALLSALANIDTTRLSVITVDPASLRKVSGADESGNPVAYYEQLLRDSGIFDLGLTVGVLDFQLDYMGQMSSISTATFDEPLLWGRIVIDDKKQTTDPLGVMPRRMITLLIGSRTRVENYIDNLTTAINADRTLQGLRGPQYGELTYTANGQTVTQEPFGFEWNATIIARPGMGFYSQTTAGAAIAAATAQTATAPSGLPLVNLHLNAGGQVQSHVLTLRFPVAQTATDAKLDVSTLTGAGIHGMGSLLLSDVLPNTPANAPVANSAQTLTYRDKLYVFTAGEDSNAFSITAITQEGDMLVCTIAVNGALLKPGYYRLRLSADVTADQVVWQSIPWIDGAQSVSASVSDADLYTWQTFAASIAENDRDSKGLPKMFQHAWGPYTEKLYHGLRVPDFPPVYRSIHLKELTTQIRAAAASDTSPLIRYTFEVFVPNPQ